MEHTIEIRYKTPEGVTGTWTILRSAVRGTDDASLKAYLQHWHPEYTYVGRVSAAKEQS